MDLVVPAPNTTAVQLDAEVGTCASDLAAKTTPEYAAFRQWLQREIWAAPAIFGDSKAFLHTRLKGAGVDGLAPQEFARMNFTKLLKREGARVGRHPDGDRCRSGAGLGIAARSQQRPRFGFAETLDNLRYRDDFEVKEFLLSSLQGLAETLRAPNPGAAEPAPNQSG